MPQMEGLGISFMSKNRQQIMQSKIVLSALLAILVVGISQFAFAEEPEKTTHIAVDEEKFQQPSSKYNYHEIVFLGFVEDYSRGEQVTITIISPDESENEINTYASKSQIGIHQVILQYQDVEIASTTFEILENS
jgi:hypothetical protein